MKNQFNRKPIVAYIGTNSFLARKFVSEYHNEFIFKPVKLNICNTKKISKWLKRNDNINIFTQGLLIQVLINKDTNKPTSIPLKLKDDLKSYA